MDQMTPGPLDSLWAENRALAAEVARLSGERDAYAKRMPEVIETHNHWKSRAVAAEAEVVRLSGERDRNARKVEAYDNARATVKIEGNSRAYYVLRAENAEADVERLREAAMPFVIYGQKQSIGSVNSHRKVVVAEAQFQALRAALFAGAGQGVSDGKRAF